MKVSLVKYKNSEPPLTFPLLKKHHSISYAFDNTRKIHLKVALSGGSLTILYFQTVKLLGLKIIYSINR